MTRPEDFLKPAFGVATLRPERGYLVAKCDANSVNHPDSLRRQIGHFYGVKKVRNTFSPFWATPFLMGDPFKTPAPARCSSGNSTPPRFVSPRKVVTRFEAHYRLAYVFE
jgi:hypothetical protein